MKGDGKEYTTTMELTFCIDKLAPGTGGVQMDGFAPPAPPPQPGALTFSARKTRGHFS